MNPSKNFAFASKKAERHYWLQVFLYLGLGLVFALGLLLYDNPVPVTSPSFWPVVKNRLTGILAMVVIAVSQSLATIAFQSITSNRIITPSIMGFDSIYIFIQTATIYFFGTRALIGFQGLFAFVIEVSIMIAACLLLYRFYLKSGDSDLHLTLMIGIVLSEGLNSTSGFMRRALSPTEYDVLQSNLFGSVSNADQGDLTLALVIVIVVAGLLLAYAGKLNILSLGRDMAINLGLNFKYGTIYVLVLISLLMAVSTALVGRVTFFGFLVATLTYLLAPTYDHRYLFPFSLSLSFMMITGAYFILRHIFAAQGVVSIIIEIIGGLCFLVVLLKRGKL